MSKLRNNINETIYKEVLKRKETKYGENKGFRVNDNKVFTYGLKKDSFTYFYSKGKVLEDGITTTYLEI